MVQNFFEVSRMSSVYKSIGGVKQFEINYSYVIEDISNPVGSTIKVSAKFFNSNNVNTGISQIFDVLTNRTLKKMIVMEQNLLTTNQMRVELTIWRASDNLIISDKYSSPLINIQSDGVVSPPNQNSITTSINNASYKQTQTDQRNFKFDVNYNINNISQIPLGTTVKVFAQFGTTNGIITQILELPRTLSNQSGIISVSFFDHSPYVDLPDNTMNVNVFMWTQDDIPISQITGITLNLQALPPPVITNKAFKINYFDGTSTNQILSIDDFSFIQSIPLPSVWTLSNIIDTTQQTNKSLTTLLDEIEIKIDLFNNPIPPPPPPPPEELPNTLFDLVFVDGSRLDFVLTDNEFQTFVNNQEFQTVALENVRDSNANAITLQHLRELIIAHLQSIEDPTVTNDMVTHTINDFEIIDNRLVGSISYVANANFNPFWYGKEIHSIMQIKDIEDIVVLTKTNSLFFYENQRDETIFIDEFTEAGRVKLEFFVSDPSFVHNFAPKKTIIVQIGQPPPPDPNPDPSSSSNITLEKGLKVGVGLVVGKLLFGGLFK